VRVLALPRLFGPAVLALATYLVTSLRESEEPVRFNARLLEETAVLAVAGALVIGVACWRGRGGRRGGRQQLSITLPTLVAARLTLNDGPR